MKYVALLSGGKDSCYNLLHCQHHGHELIAAASLGPPTGKEEMDSYMYQTVGQDAIELVARALDVPLYRRVIEGQSKEQGMDYGSRMTSAGVEGDETEDLYILLSTVKDNHPDVQGVSVGAILSNYQRVRVEHVCRRLKLTPLSYLWQRDQRELLSEMIHAGLTAVLIKVAGIGLSSKHLGKTLGEMKATLERLNSQYGLHVCGEGGEYETLTIDSPMFKHRILLNEVEIVSDDGFAEVAYLRIKAASLEPKTPVPMAISIPSLLDEPFTAILEVGDQTQAPSSSEDPLGNPNKEGPGDLTASHSQSLELSAANGLEPDECCTYSRHDLQCVGIGNIQRKSSRSSKDIPFEEEVRECFSSLKIALSQYSLDLCNVSIINVFLSSMDLFGEMNSIYACHFGTGPPARACVAVDLPSPIRIRLDCIANRSASRQVLHVQGLSYWAPANIGPYSQAIVVNEQIYVSGQIGLIPSSLSLPSPRSLKLEAALAFQHTHRVLDALRGSGGAWEAHIQGAIYWCSHSAHCAVIKQAEAAYQTPSHPALFVAAKSLPKGALVEKQIIARTGRRTAREEDDEEVIHHSPEYNSGAVLSSTCEEQILWEMSYFPDAYVAEFCAVLFVNSTEDVGQSRWPREFGIIRERGGVSARLFHTTSESLAKCQLICRQLFDVDTQPATTPIPCRSILSRPGKSWDSAILIVGAM